MIEDFDDIETIADLEIYGLSICTIELRDSMK